MTPLRFTRVFGLVLAIKKRCPVSCVGDVAITFQENTYNYLLFDLVLEPREIDDEIYII